MSEGPLAGIGGTESGCWAVLLTPHPLSAMAKPTNRQAASVRKTEKADTKRSMKNPRSLFDRVVGALRVGRPVQVQFIGLQIVSLK